MTPRDRRNTLRRALAATLWLCCTTAVTAPARAADSPLPAAAAEALQRAAIPADALGVVVLPVAPARWRSGPRLDRQPDRPMQPGSAMKLVTAIVALDRLGPNVRGFTELLTRAPQQGEVLAGDLVLRGGADPELGLPQLWAMLAELRHGLGIREIAGDIVIDRQLFRPARPDLGAPPFDEQPEFPYNTIPDALNLAGSAVPVELSSQDPARPGEVAARTVPALPGLVIDAGSMRPTERACRDWARDWLSPPRVDEPAPGVLRVALQGGFPNDCTVRLPLQLIDRTALAERQLRWLWQGLGGQWQGRAREADAPLIPAVEPAASPSALPGAALLAPGVAWAGDPPATPAGVRVLARHLARPWGEVLRPLNKQSDNPLTRLLYLQLGLAGMAAEPDTPTAALAARAVQRWFVDHDIAGAGLVIENGSGLSRSERITPRQLALMLKAAHAGRWAPELLASLPVAGVDGTMRNRLKTGPAAGMARMKTGTLRNVAALAGYVADPQGRVYALAAMINHEQAQAGRPALDALVDWVARGGMSLPGRRP
ncbi:MAG: D-alanyl-D-alanine carboxypeptidase [Burkholderiaceae bacterium]|nr:D-alanyl-D-alanine carboxypeptidase [Burkholderiaceae bacterium]